jgi:zinc and cadmium transporter
MNLLLLIVVSTLAAGIGSVWIAAGLMRGGWLTGHDARGRGMGEQHLLSLAAGALLATSFMHLLPEALEGAPDTRALLATLLAGVVFFFLLDKAELWHHGHEHHHGANGGRETHEGHDGHGSHRGHSHVHPHEHAHSHGHSHAPSGGWIVLTGDSVHCFGDGILIASAFMADPRLGFIAAVSVLAHEVPHHISDLVVLRQASNRRAALLKVSLAGAVTSLGGLAGWWLLDALSGYLPFFLVVASSSFIYVALADLVPQLQKRQGARETVVQVAWLLLGIALVTLVSRVAHVH